MDNVQGDDCAIGIFRRFASGSVADNTATRCLDAISSNWSQGLSYTGNAVSSPGTGYETVGIHTDNAGWGGTADSITGNQVTGCDRGIFVFYPNQAVTVSGNTVSQSGIGLGLHGGTGIRRYHRLHEQYGHGKGCRCGGRRRLLPLRRVSRLRPGVRLRSLRRQHGPRLRNGRARPALGMAATLSSTAGALTGGNVLTSNGAGFHILASAGVCPP